MRFIICTVFMLILSGCGGRGGTSGNASGHDTPVRYALSCIKAPTISGLGFRSGNTVGVTDAAGCFQYEEGRGVTFDAGFTLGAIEKPGSTVTFADIERDASARINKLRFLMMLDENQSSDDMVTISEGVRSRWRSWSQPDFGEANLSEVVQSIRADAISADGGLHLLPTSDDAVARHEAGMICTYSGSYAGGFAAVVGNTNYYGVHDLSGNLGVVVWPDGSVSARSFYFGTDGVPVPFGDLNPSPLSIDLPFFTTNTYPHYFAGPFNSRNELSGIWRSFAYYDDVPGKFLATRSAGRHDAISRYTALLVDAAEHVVIVSLDVYVRNAVTLTVMDEYAQREDRVDGYLEGENLYLQGTKYAFEGRRTSFPRRLTGTLTSSDSSALVDACGCGL